MDVAEPPRIVFESPARCGDGRRAQELLEHALSQARAPSRGWTVTMRVEAQAPGALHAEGEITDDHDAPVGHRAFDRRAGDCSALARAIGVWATLVLDAEMNRPRNVARADDGNKKVDPEGASDAQAADDSGKLQPAAATSDTESTPSWPPATPGEKPGADREPVAHREDGRTLEIGAGSFLMGGTGGGLVAGVTPFVLVEIVKGVFLRPAFVFGGALPQSGPDVTLAVGRLDTCLRVAGLYTSRHGMQLDICGGADAGVVATRETLPYVAFGPSLDLRGELGGDLAAALRGLLDVNAVQEQRDSLDTPLVAGRVELALSWRLR